MEKTLIDTHSKKDHKYPEFTPICRFWRKNNCCKYDNSCKFRHFITDDEMLQDRLHEVDLTARKRPFKLWQHSKMDKKIINIETGCINYKSITLNLCNHKQNENTILFSTKQTIYSDYDHDFYTIMEGAIILKKASITNCNCVQWIITDISIHRTTEYDGDTYGGNLMAATHKSEYPKTVRQFV